MESSTEGTGFSVVVNGEVAEEILALSITLSHNHQHICV
jgi:hypothetical protein